MSDWYDNLEAPIRDVVRLLRDNGFNTTNSCGHSMTVELDLGNNVDESERLANVLHDAGHKVFLIQIDLIVPDGGFWIRRATLHIGKWHL